MTTPKPQPPARTHPDDRKRIEAGNAVTRLYRGAPDTKPPISYYTPILIQCTLPHSDPKVRDWKKTNGNFTLLVSSGVDKQTLQPYGIPYGSFPRLMLAHIITRVVQTGERQIELSSHFSHFMKEIGYTGNLRGHSRQAKSIQSQVDRLLNSRIEWEISGGTEEQGKALSGRADVANKRCLWWDFKSPDQGSLFGSWIELGEDFYTSILSAPVPLSTEILAALRKSPLALDVYMWASHRLYTMQQSGQEQISLSYGNLQTQFGSGIAEENYRQFRRELKLAFEKVASHWHAPNSDLCVLNYEFEESNFVLHRSPLLIGKAKLKAAAAEAANILTVRAFDMETRKKARVIAGKWSVDFLQGQYFEWLTQEGITPKNPRAHFFQFIKSHKKRNGDPV